MHRIVVASDSASLRHAIASVASAVDPAVIEATNGDEVVAAILEHQAYLVVLDLQVANMGGPAICRNLRSEADSGRMPEVKIICLLDRAVDEFQARRAEADAWLLKPPGPRQLRKTIEILLDPRQVWRPEVVEVDPPDEPTTLEESAAVATQAAAAE